MEKEKTQEELEQEELEKQQRKEEWKRRLSLLLLLLRTNKLLALIGLVAFLGAGSATIIVIKPELLSPEYWEGKEELTAYEKLERSLSSDEFLDKLDSDEEREYLRKLLRSPEGKGLIYDEMRENEDFLDFMGSDGMSFNEREEREREREKQKRQRDKKAKPGRAGTQDLRSTLSKKEVRKIKKDQKLREMLDRLFKKGSPATKTSAGWIPSSAQPGAIGRTSVAMNSTSRLSRRGGVTGRTARLQASARSSAVGGGAQGTLNDTIYKRDSIFSGLIEPLDTDQKIHIYQIHLEGAPGEGSTGLIANQTALSGDTPVLDGQELSEVANYTDPGMADDTTSVSVGSGTFSWTVSCAGDGMASKKRYKHKANITVTRPALVPVNVFANKIGGAETSGKYAQVCGCNGCEARKILAQAINDAQGNFLGRYILTYQLQAEKLDPDWDDACGCDWKGWGDSRRVIYDHSAGTLQ
ncbi:hypothetical protein ACFL6Y_06750 [Elusimicrobiota bacterium]